MRLLRYGPEGAEKPGLLDAEGGIRDLSGEIADITPDVLAADRLARLAALDTATLPAVGGAPRLGPPIAAIPNLVCIGLNYADHARETNSPIPEAPIVFMKHTGLDHRPERSGQDPARLDQDRLGGGTRCGDRQARLLCRGERRDGSRGWLLRGQ